MDILTITLLVGALIALVLLVVAHGVIRRLDADRAELLRWRLAHLTAKQWMAEFKDAADALEAVRAVAAGDAGIGTIPDVRENMRRRRDWAVHKVAAVAAGPTWSRDA